MLFAISATAWAMAAVFLGVTLVGDRFSAGDPGIVLARVFAGALALSGVFMFFLGLVLLRDERHRLDHYGAPMIIGAIVGAIEAWLFLHFAGSWLIVPPFFILLSLRPLRRLFVAMLPGGGDR